MKLYGSQQNTDQCYKLFFYLVIIFPIKQPGLKWDVITARLTESKITLGEHLWKTY